MSVIDESLVAAIGRIDVGICRTHEQWKSGLHAFLSARFGVVDADLVQAVLDFVMQHPEPMRPPDKQIVSV